MNGDEFREQLRPFLRETLSQEEEQDLNELVRFWSATSNLSQNLQLRLEQWLEEQLSGGRRGISTEPVFLQRLPFQSAMSAILLKVNDVDVATYDEELLQLTSTFFAVEPMYLKLSQDERLMMFAVPISVQQAIHFQMTLEQEFLVGVLVAVSLSFDPTKQLVDTVQELRSVLRIGRGLLPAERVFPTWKFQLESLFAEASESMHANWLIALVDQLRELDRESVETIRHFFDNDCNIGDTAKSMHIHRNTLMYRLEKIRLECGCDLRRFHDAVKLKLAWTILHSAK